MHAWHEQGIAHLNLKESNAGVDAHGDVVLFDAGASERLEGGSVTVRSPTGTPGYMSPEAARASDATPGVLTRASDVFSLGVMVSYALRRWQSGSQQARWAGCQVAWFAYTRTLHCVCAVDSWHKVGTKLLKWADACKHLTPVTVQICPVCAMLALHCCGVQQIEQLVECAQPAAGRAVLKAVASVLSPGELEQ